MPYCPQQVSEAEAMFTFTIVIASLTHTGDTVSDSSIGLTAAMTRVPVSYSKYVIIIN